MKISHYCFTLLAMAACHKPTVVTQATPPPGQGTLDYIKIIPVGDLNNDNIFDEAHILGPKYLGEEKLYGDCSNGACSVNITFSTGQPGLHFENAVSADVENIGDIDKDGFAEILIAPSWWVGCRGRIHVYSYKNKAWKYYGYAENNICGRDKLSEFILKTEGNTLSLEEIVWDENLEDETEKPKIFVIQ